MQTAFNAAVLAIIASIPGVVVTFFNLRVGLAMVLAGCCLGILLSLPAANPNRVFKATILLTFLRSVPGMDEHLCENELSEKDEFHFVVGNWLLGTDIPERRNGLMLLTLLVGLVVGLVAAYLESKCVNAGNHFLFAEAADWPVDKVFLVYLLAAPSLICIAIGCLFLPAYRRPILFFSFVPVVATACVAISGQSLIVPFVFVLLTGDIGVIMGWLFTYR